MTTVRVTGAEQLASLSKALRSVAKDERKGLRRELYRGIMRATRPLKQAAQESARSTLPSSGGLAAAVARSKFKTKTAGGGANVGVRILATGGTDIRAMDAGRLRHPVYGNRSVWVTQSVTPGWFTRPMEAGAGRVQVEILRAMDSVADQIGRSV